MDILNPLCSFKFIYTLAWLKEFLLYGTMMSDIFSYAICSMQVEVCRLSNLPDLNQSNSYVSSTLTNWIQKTVSQYKFDGLRVDTTPEVSKSFWPLYAKASGVFTMGEVFNGDPSYVAGYQGPLASTLNYPMYYKLYNAFQKKQSMTNVHDGVAQNVVFPDVSVLGNFLDNHDNPRFLYNNPDTTILKNALAYVVFAEVCL